MTEQGLACEHIHDLVGGRVLVNTVRDCYTALGMIHAAWQQAPGQFEDYIITPKINLYQSLHTTVTGPTGSSVGHISTTSLPPTGRGSRAARGLRAIGFVCSRWMSYSNETK